MIKINDKAVFMAIYKGKNITIFFTGKIQQKHARAANQGFYTSLKMDGMNAQNVAFVSHLEQIHILNTAEYHWMFGTNCCGGLYMDLRQTRQQKKLNYHKSWYTGVL